MQRRDIPRARGIALLATLLVAGAHAAQASTLWTFVTSGGGSYVQSWGSSYGNTRKFTQDGEVVWTTAWSDVGTGSFDTAFVGRYSSGLGVCNRLEGSIRDCTSAGIEHQVDNVSQQDFVLFRFESLVSLQSIIVDPTGTWDRDVTFWVGTIDPALSLAGKTVADLATLGFGPAVNLLNPPGEGPLSVSLLGSVGNALLVSALQPADDSPDRFKIRSLSASVAVVPVPAASWLFLSAAGLLAAVRRRLA